MDGSGDQGMWPDDYLSHSHVTHKIHLDIQVSKHCKYLQDRHEWTDAFGTVLIGED
jgi:hypothetical protein